VVALDGSKAAEAGLAMARELAATLESRLVLVQAYTIPPPGVDFVSYPSDLSTLLRESSEKYLAETARAGEEVACSLGPAVDIIAGEADRVDAGLVVMTSHGKGLVQRISLGSTTDRTIHRVKRPILVVPAA
jgi:nucleotide-binding universal stress UspA family protein